MPLAQGTRLGPYEVLGSLGAGGMGEVYRAKDTKLNRDVAIKILRDVFAHDTDRVARFTREAQTLASLNHPNIAQLTTTGLGCRECWGWLSDTELYWQDAARRVSPVAVTARDGRIDVAAPTPLFGCKSLDPAVRVKAYAIDRERFVVTRPAGPTPPAELAIVSDWRALLDGAFPLHQAQALLTRDRGFYRRYFKRLRIVEPG